MVQKLYRQTKSIPKPVVVDADKEPAKHRTQATNTLAITVQRLLVKYWHYQETCTLNTPKHTQF
jgi:hypothetical protein